MRVCLPITQISQRNSLSFSLPKSDYLLMLTLHEDEHARAFPANAIPYFALTQPCCILKELQLYNSFEIPRNDSSSTTLDVRIPHNDVHINGTRICESSVFL